jgi:DNA end-binding protein Ku
MKAIWTGAIGFGLVNIPVKIYSAIEDTRPDFDLLDGKSFDRIRYKRVNERTGKEVDWNQIVKAHYLKDKYIVLEDEDFDNASPEKTKMIQLQSFVNEIEIESIYFDAPYFLLPQKGGEKAYSLLLQALKKTKKAGLSTFVMRASESVAIIRPYEGILLLNKLRFHENIRSVVDIKPAISRIQKSEMDMAVQLIKRHSSPFNIEDYKDEYSKELMKVIRAKAKGRQTKVRKFVPAKKTGDNLLDQLKQSLA